MEQKVFYKNDLYASPAINILLETTAQITNEVIINRQIPDKAEVPLIKSGDEVKLVYKNNGMTISTSGQALQDGQHNQRIRVLSKTFSKIITGIVLNRNTIIIK